MATTRLSPGYTLFPYLDKSGCLQRIARSLARNGIYHPQCKGRKPIGQGLGYIKRNHIRVVLEDIAVVIIEASR